jgi:hypothetical protein
VVGTGGAAELAPDEETEPRSDRRALSAVDTLEEVTVSSDWDMPGVGGSDVA